MPDPDPNKPEKSEREIQLEAELKRARDEAADRRVKLREYEEAEDKRKADLKAKDDADAAKRGEFEKLEAERKLEAEALKRSIAQREANLKKKLIDAALQAKLADAVDPDVIKLIDRKGIEVDDETYEVKGLDEIVTSFRESKPHFFSKPGETKPHTPAPPKPGSTKPDAVDWRNVKSEDLNAQIASTIGVQI